MQRRDLRLSLRVPALLRVGQARDCTEAPQPDSPREGFRRAFECRTVWFHPHALSPAVPTPIFNPLCCTSS